MFIFLAPSGVVDIVTPEFIPVDENTLIRECHQHVPFLCMVVAGKPRRYRTYLRHYPVAVTLFPQVETCGNNIHHALRHFILNLLKYGSVFYEKWDNSRKQIA